MWAIILIIFLILCLYLVRKPSFYPPGPPLLPLIGNLLSVWLGLKQLKYHHKVWQELSRKYGEILGLKLGGVNVVVVSGRDRIREVLSRDVFDGRPDGFFYMLRSFGKKLGIVFADGPSWHATRRVVLKYLKNFGYGTRNMDSIISEECKELVKLRFDDAGSPILVNEMFNVAIVNILWRLVAGKRYSLKDPRLLKLCELVARSFKVVDMSGGVLNFLPCLRHLCPDLIGYTELKDIHGRLYKFIKGVIKEHEDSINVSSPRDVIDTFLIEMLGNKENAFTEEELQVVCLDLLEAGLETVGNTIVFMLLHVVMNSHVQKRLHQEIDDVIGPSREPLISDRSSMAYTEAVLLESLRISSVAAVGIPHMALDDALLGQYVIPKGTFILLAYYDLHNGDHWSEPHVFRPERFLDKEGNLIQDDWLMPFGAGRRRCIGEGLARSELFLFLTHILQKFTLQLPPGDVTPSSDPEDGVSLSAKPFRIVFKPKSKWIC